MTRNLKTVLLILFIACHAGYANNISTPEGWILAGDCTSTHTTSFLPHNGGRAVTLSSIYKDSSCAGRFIQNIDAGTYRGKTITISADVLNKDRMNRAGLYANYSWQGFVKNHIEIIPIKSGWTRQNITLQIPQHARFLTFGISLSNGSVSFDNFSISISDTGGESLQEIIQNTNHVIEKRIGAIRHFSKTVYDSSAFSPFTPFRDYRRG